MDPKIDFYNIESPSLRHEVRDIMEELIQLCPSDAAVRATFRFFQGHFLADIKIASESVYMTAIDQAGALGEVLDHVKARIMDQILEWRSHRFAS